MKTSSALWRRFFYWFIVKVYFARVTVLNGNCRQQKGPALYLGLHRNGAVDGFVYHYALRSPTFLISTQLMRNWFARLFFTGIAVTRTKDEGDRCDNDHALQQCLEHLQGGGSLFIFPEGTSSLRPRHLPFKSGALWLILRYLENPGPPLRVIPVGIHYECPWDFRSKVEVVLGKPLDLALSPSLDSKVAGNEAAYVSATRAGSDLAASLDIKDSPLHIEVRQSKTGADSSPHPSLPKKNGKKISVLRRFTESERGTPFQGWTSLKELKQRARLALEAIGINVVSEAYQDQIHRLAYVSTLATPRSYFGSLKALEHEIPKPISQAAKDLENLIKNRRLLFHQGVPLVPMGAVSIYAFAFVLLAPVVGLAMILNAPPVLAGWFAGKKLPDEANVISLWKVLVGIPVFLVWLTLIGTVCLVLGKPAWLLFYLVLTWAGLDLYYRVKKLGVAVYNGLRYPRLRPALVRFRQTVLEHLPPDPFSPKP